MGLGNGVSAQIPVCAALLIHLSVASETAEHKGGCWGLQSTNSAKLRKYPFGNIKVGLFFKNKGMVFWGL
jgi:hypothetical protein